MPNRADHPAWDGVGNLENITGLGGSPGPGAMHVRPSNRNWSSHAGRSRGELAERKMRDSIHAHDNSWWAKAGIVILSAVVLDMQALVRACV